jgi:hypothetical protein
MWHPHSIAAPVQLPTIIDDVPGPYLRLMATFTDRSGTAIALESYFASSLLSALCLSSSLPLSGHWTVALVTSVPVTGQTRT